MNIFQIDSINCTGAICCDDKVTDKQKMMFYGTLQKFLSKVVGEFCLVSKPATNNGLGLIEDETYVFNKYSVASVSVPMILFCPKYCIGTDIADTLKNVLKNRIEIITANNSITENYRMKLTPSGKEITEMFNRQICIGKKTIGGVAYNRINGISIQGRNALIVITSNVELVCNMLGGLSNQLFVENFDVYIVWHSREDAVIATSEAISTIYNSKQGQAIQAVTNLTVIEGPQKRFNYGAIHNMVLRHITAKDYVYNYFVLCNDDIVFQISNLTLLNLVSTAIEEEADIVGSALYYPDGTYQHSGVKVESGRIYNIHGVNKYFYTRRCSSVTFALVCIKSDSLYSLMFNEDYFGDCSDIEFCLRALQKKMKIYYCADAEAVHLESKTRANDKLLGKDEGCKKFYIEHEKEIKEEFIF